MQLFKENVRQIGLREKSMWVDYGARGGIEYGIYQIQTSTFSSGSVEIEDVFFNPIDVLIDVVDQGSGNYTIASTASYYSSVDSFTVSKTFNATIRVLSNVVYVVSIGES
tara:strand:- start:624 stop:953 length:330 start_codon:yes stop_codon:yes gene_type:complete